jgi:hypothetical protein
MQLTFITFQHVTEAIKNLVANKQLSPDGKVSRGLISATWAALHEGYRGQKYDGADAGKAIANLRKAFLAEAVALPADGSDGEFLEEALRKDDSFDSIRSRVMDQINSNIRAGIDMDADGDGPQDAIEYASAWCQDIFPGVVVYSMNGKLLQCDYTIGSDDSVTLGMPEPVEMAYQPATTSAEEGDRSTPARAMAVECDVLEESSYDAAKGELTVTIIRPGFSKNSTKGRKRFYPAETLRESAPVFKGAKMFADHATEAEDKARPEGSIRNWVANVSETWAESDGTVKGRATVIDPPFKAKLDRLKEAGLLNEMGVSVRIAGAWSPAEIEGQEAARIDEIVSARSVDFVTYAGAGGHVEAMEAEHEEFDIDLIDEAQLRARRPDLVALIESSAHQERNTMKSLETQLQEATTELAAAKQKLQAAEAQIADSEKAAQKANAQTELAKLLAESKLPDAAQNRIRAQFKDSVAVEGMKEAIEAEREYIKSFANPTRVTNLGKENNGTNADAAADARKSMKESFMKSGMSEKEAELAAAGR